MKIYFFKYQLKKKFLLNAKDNSQVENGALIKVEDNSGHWGVADLKPWPLLGDLYLDEELSTKGPLFRRSLKLAEDDMIARRNKKSLLKDQVMNNNILITDFSKCKLDKMVGSTIKIKASKNLEQLENFLIRAATLNLKIRIDFNSVLEAAEFESFIYRLPTAVLKKIEYIEDPTAEIQPDWSQWNRKVPLAVDFCTRNYRENKNAWTFLIIKPSRQNSDALIIDCMEGEKQFTLTSSMDHPVGIAHGLRFAQEFPEMCVGFSTLQLYESTEFHNYFVQHKDTINFSAEALADYGIGMTKALQKLNWTAL